jgi:hypothetical protein
VSGFEPLTVRLQGGCSAKLSYTGRLVRVASDAEPLPGYRFGRVSANKLPPPWRRPGMPGKEGMPGVTS